MKLRWLIVVILFCIAAVTSSFARAAASETPLTPLEQTIIGAEKSFIEAAKKGDAEFFKRTLTEDFSDVGFDGQLYDRQEALDGVTGGGVDLMPYNFKVVTAGEGTAIVTYDVVLRVPAAEDQGPPPRYQHFSSVWVKQGNQWKLKFQQATPTHWGDW